VNTWAQLDAELHTGPTSSSYHQQDRIERKLDVLIETIATLVAEIRAGKK
jgi:hypothetical protein